MDRCDIVITAFRLNAVQPPARALQHILGLSPSDAAVLARSFPCVVRANEDAEEAERLCMALNAAGAHTELQAHVERLEAAQSAVEPATEHAAAGRYVIGDLTIGAPASPRPAVAPAVVSGTPGAPVPAAVSQGGSPTKSTAESAVSGNVQMLDDGFGGEAEHGDALELDRNSRGSQANQAAAQAVVVDQGPSSFDDEDAEGAALELDYGAGLNRSSKVEVKKPVAKGVTKQADAKGGDGADRKTLDPSNEVAAKKTASAESARRGQIHVRDRTPDAHGFWATLFLPLVLFYGAAPRLCIVVGIAAASAIGAYAMYGSGAEEHSASTQALPKQPTRKLKNVAPKKKGGHLLSATKDDSAPEAASAGKAGAEVMEYSVALAKRERMHGIHQVEIEWPAAAKHADNTDCMLLDAKYANKLDELASTGTRIKPPPAVEQQLNRKIEALQSSRRYRGRTFLPLCLSN